MSKTIIKPYDRFQYLRNLYLEYKNRSYRHLMSRLREINSKPMSVADIMGARLKAPHFWTDFYYETPDGIAHSG